MSFSDELIFRA